MCIHITQSPARVYWTDVLPLSMLSSVFAQPDANEYSKVCNSAMICIDTPSYYYLFNYFEISHQTCTGHPSCGDSSVYCGLTCVSVYLLILSCTYCLLSFIGL
jgi:hypothetical protein